MSNESPPVHGPLRFDGRVAVVTGAGQGLGRSHAVYLASRGASVVVNDVTPSDGQSRSAAVVEEISRLGGSAVAIDSDISTDDGAAAVVQRALDSFTHLDIIVNNAGVVHTGPFADATTAILQQTFEVHVFGTWGLLHAAWNHMAERGYGRIINTTSAAGLYGIANPPMAAYSAAKGAIYALTRSLAAEGAAVGITVNGLAPRAFTPTQAVHMDDAAQAARLAATIPAEAVSAVLAALAHDSCTMSGEIIFAGGGTVRRAFMAETVGVDLGLSITPEATLSNLPTIMDADNYSVPQPYEAPSGMR